MKRAYWIAALTICCGSANADAGLFDCFKKKGRCHASCSPSCAAPAECCPSCAAPSECCPPAEPSCCAPAEPECCVPAVPVGGVPAEAVPMTEPAPAPAEPAPAPPEAPPAVPQAMLQDWMEEAFFPVRGAQPQALKKGTTPGMSNRIAIGK